MVEAAPCMLIVDPDEAFRTALALEVEAAGLRAICCRDWWTAQPIIEGPELIAAMIVELALPYGTPNGVSTALMARRRRRGLPMIFICAEPDLLKEVQHGTGMVLAKSVGAALIVRCAVETAEGSRGTPSTPVPQAFLSPRLSLDPRARYRLDRDGRFRSVSDGALALWRKDRADLLGRPMLEVFPELAGRPKFDVHLRVLAGGAPFTGVVTSVILKAPIDIRIAPDRSGLKVEFALAA
jgi:hypothetical protein